jgi:hypothetical protein
VTIVQAYSDRAKERDFKYQLKELLRKKYLKKIMKVLIPVII